MAMCEASRNSCSNRVHKLRETINYAVSLPEFYNLVHSLYVIYTLNLVPPC